MLRKEKMGGIYGQRRRDLYWQYCRISECMDSDLIPGENPRFLLKPCN